MVLGVSQTNDGTKLASLDIDQNNHFSNNLRKRNNRIDFVKPLSINSSTAQGRRMVSAYTAGSFPAFNSSGSYPRQDSPYHLLAIVASAGSVIASSTAAVAASIKQLLPHKTYTIESGHKFSWPAFRLSHAQLSNSVIVGLLLAGISSFALWVPANGTDTVQNPPAVLGTSTDSPSVENKSTNTNNDQIAQGNPSSWTTPSLRNTAAPVQSNQPANYVKPEQVLSGVTAEQVIPPIITDPLPEVIDPVVGGSGGGNTLPVIPEIPVIPEVVSPTIEAVDDTLGTVTNIAGSF